MRLIYDDEKQITDFFIYFAFAPNFDDDPDAKILSGFFVA